jgi:hypothetical protein
LAFGNSLVRPQCRKIEEIIKTIHRSQQFENAQTPASWIGTRGVYEWTGRFMIRKIQHSVGDLYRFEIIEVYGEEE